MTKEKGKTSSDLSAARREGKLGSTHARQQIIAENAYFRALNRGFQGGARSRIGLPRNARSTTSHTGKSGSASAICQQIWLLTTSLLSSVF